MVRPSVSAISPARPTRSWSVTTTSSSPTAAAIQKKRPLRKAIRLLNIGLIILCVPLLFAWNASTRPDPTITGPITAITAQNESAPQTADLVDTTAPLTVIHAQPGFHCYAGCSFLKPTRTIDPLAGQNPGYLTDANRAQDCGHLNWQNHIEWYCDFQDLEKIHKNH